MYTHSCIKCREKYNDKDPDPYYCSSCNEARKAIAKEIDQKALPSSRQGKSDLQIYDEIRKAKGVQFVNIADLGIKL